ncbi:MAG: hypothetical protein HY318_16325, partial [Armatimonadetes bacterium]|nr:hypothetical protein [Armatimonadota bacterium]
MIEHLPMVILFLSCFALLAASEAGTQEQLLLENKQLALHFDPATGRLRALQNKLTGETYQVNGDGFAVEAVEFRLDAADVRLVSLKRRRGSIEALYHSADLKIIVTYTLGRDHHFAEKRLTLTSDRDRGLRNITLSRPTFFAPSLDLVCYRYPQFGRLPGAEPICTYFGRTPKGGFFTGVELPFDASALNGQQVTLAYAPSLKVKAGEKLLCEPVYFGVYERHAADEFPSEQTPMRGTEDNTSPTSEILPLPSESDAMVAMTSAILGPPRHGLVPMACGWHCEMEQYTYADTAAVEADMLSLDVIAECGLDWVSDSHPWGGETEKMNALAEDQKYEPGPLVRRFLEHARKIGIKVVMWPTMNHTHPWWNKGRPFRADKPEWLMTPKSLDDKPDFIKSAKANCFANTPFLNWLSRINSEGLATGYYKSWAMDGSFFGDGGWFTSIIPVDCASDQHDHLPGDSNYACERALSKLIAGVRHQCPDTYIFTCRPPMDLGVWSLRNVDACFTLLETGTGSSNVAAGDDIRKWSRVRVHHHFFPHYVDQPLLFPSRANRHAPPDWPSEKLDYILLSALSCSPNQLFYLPTKTGLPDKDRAEIRKWLDWGRANIAYLKVRKDLPDWPGADKVD